MLIVLYLLLSILVHLNLIQDSSENLHRLMYLLILVNLNTVDLIMFYEIALWNQIRWKRLLLNLNHVSVLVWRSRNASLVFLIFLTFKFRHLLNSWNFKFVIQIQECRIHTFLFNLRRLFFFFFFKLLSLIHSYLFILTTSLRKIRILFIMFLDNKVLWFYGILNLIWLLFTSYFIFLFY